MRCSAVIGTRWQGTGAKRCPYSRFDPSHSNSFWEIIPSEVEHTVHISLFKIVRTSSQDFCSSGKLDTGCDAAFCAANPFPLRIWNNRNSSDTKISARRGIRKERNGRMRFITFTRGYHQSPQALHTRLLPQSPIAPQGLEKFARNPIRSLPN